MADSALGIVFWLSFDNCLNKHLTSVKIIEQLYQNINNQLKRFVYLSHMCKPSLKCSCSLISPASGVKFVLKLHLSPNFVYHDSMQIEMGDGSGEYVHLCMLVRALIAEQSAKCQNPMS